MQGSLQDAAADMNCNELTCQICILNGALVILGLKGLKNDGHEQHQQYIVAKHDPSQYEDQCSKVGVVCQLELDIVIVFQCQHLRTCILQWLQWKSKCPCKSMQAGDLSPLGKGQMCAALTDTG